MKTKILESSDSLASQVFVNEKNEKKKCSMVIRKKEETCGAVCVFVCECESGTKSMGKKIVEENQ